MLTYMRPIEVVQDIQSSCVRKRRRKDIKKKEKNEVRTIKDNW